MAMTVTHEEASLGAVRACARWLAYCVELGWRKEHLDELEALWWKYHDDQGRLI